MNPSPSPPETLEEALTPMTPTTTPRAETAATRATRPRTRTRSREATAIDAEMREMTAEEAATAVREAEGPATGWGPADVPPPRPRRTTRRTTSKTSRTAGKTGRRPGAPNHPLPPFDDGDGSAAAGGTSELKDAVGALADAGHAGAARKGNPTVANWEEFLTIAFGFLGMLYVWWLVAGIDVPSGEEERLMLTEEEAEALATPTARILARSWVNARWGKNVLGAGDYVMLAITTAEYARRTAPYLRRRLASFVPGNLRRRRSGVDEPAVRRQAHQEKEAANGHVAAGTPTRPVVFPAQAT